MVSFKEVCGHKSRLHVVGLMCAVLLKQIVKLKKGDQLVCVKVGIKLRQTGSFKGSEILLADVEYIVKNQFDFFNALGPVFNL